MKVFKESDLVFHFDTTWIVQKYDEHPFYQAMSGKGLSAVDFVGIQQSGKLLLMEVKNYRNRPEREVQRTFEKLKGTKPLIAAVLMEKATETIIGIQAISTYLHQKWWYHFIFRVLDRPIFCKYLLQFDRLFWMKADQILKTPKQVELALWLELPDALEGKRADLIKYLGSINEKELSNIQIYHTLWNPDFVEVKFVMDC